MPKGRLSRNFKEFAELGTTKLMEIWVKRAVFLLVIAIVAITIFQMVCR